MTPGLGFLGPEGGPKAVGTAHRHGERLVVELAALGQKGLLIEILSLEESRRPLASVGSEDGRIAEHEVALVEEAAAGGNDLVPDAQDGMLPLRAQPEVTVIEQKRRAMLFAGNGVILGDLKDLEVG